MIELHNKQFLLTKTEVHDPFFSDWDKKKVGKYVLLSHPNLEVHEHMDGSTRLISIGYLYHYQFPKLSTKEIGNKVLGMSDLNKTLEEYSNTCGESILIIHKNDETTIVNDACAQLEVYYTDDYSIVASQPKLISRIKTLSNSTNPATKIHFESETFSKKQTWVGGRTSFDEVLHLRPNHFLSLQKRKPIRFYPSSTIEKKSIDEVAIATERIISGYLKSMVNQHKGIVLPITAGVDSRVILACAIKHLESLEKVKFFTLKLPWMTDEHVDIKIAKEIAKRLSLDLKIIYVENQEYPELKEVFQKSLTLEDPAFNNIAHQAFGTFEENGITIVDGSIIGVVKNFFGHLIWPTARDLARIAGYPNSKFARKQLKEWINASKHIFKKFRLHTLDMFFWEERAGNWASKGKSKFLMTSNHVSIFNSRVLFNTMLQTKRKTRDAQRQKVFLEILKNSELPFQDIPMNPTSRKRLLLAFKRIGLYPLYRNLAIKLGLLKF